MALMPSVQRGSSSSSNDQDLVSLSDPEELYFAGRPKYFAANFCSLFRLHQKLPKVCRQFAGEPDIEFSIHEYLLMNALAGRSSFSVSSIVILAPHLGA